MKKMTRSTYNKCHTTNKRPRRNKMKDTGRKATERETSTKSETKSKTTNKTQKQEDQQQKKNENPGKWQRPEDT